MAEGETSWPGELPEDLLGRIKPELGPGERVLWAAKGDPRLKGTGWSIRGAFVWSIQLLLVGLVAVAGALGAFGSPTRGSVGPLAILGVLSAAIDGLTFCFGVIGGGISHWKANRRLAKTIYAVTDRRAIIWKPSENPKAIRISSYPRGKIKNVTRVELPEGSGDVELRLERQASMEATAFEGIAEVRRVEDLVRRTLIES